MKLPSGINAVKSRATISKTSPMRKNFNLLQLGFVDLETMQIFSMFCVMVVVIVIGAAPIDDPVQLLQRGMQEMKRNYEDIKQQ